MQADASGQYTTIQRPGKSPLIIRNWDGINTPPALLSQAPYLIHGSVPSFAAGGSIRKEYTSASVFREDMTKNARPQFDPKQKFRQPVTSSQEIGWHAVGCMQADSITGGEKVIMSSYTRSQSPDMNVALDCYHKHDYTNAKNAGLRARTDQPIESHAVVTTAQLYLNDPRYHGSPNHTTLLGSPRDLSLHNSPHRSATSPGYAALYNNSSSPSHSAYYPSHSPSHSTTHEVSSHLPPSPNMQTSDWRSERDQLLNQIGALRNEIERLREASLSAVDRREYDRVVQELTIAQEERQHETALRMQLEMELRKLSSGRTDLHYSPETVNTHQYNYPHPSSPGTLGPTSHETIDPRDDVARALDHLEHALQRRGGPTNPQSETYTLTQYTRTVSPTHQ